MTCFRITYTRKDIDIPCHAVKYAHDPKTALELLVTGTEKKGYRLKSGVLVTIKEIKEV